MKSIIRLCRLSLVLLVLSAPANMVYAESGDEEQRAILVTGASTGIGRRITEVLAEQGFFVYAGAPGNKKISMR